MGRFGMDKFSGRGNKKGSDREVTMYDAVCDDCGKDCQVPFKPSGSKPIYCSRCFEKYDDGGSDRGDRKGSRDSDMYDAVCDDCGKDCKVPFKPSSDKPIYCSRCFEKRGNGREDGRSNRSSGGDSRNNFKDEFEGIHKKLDLILSILESRDI